MRLLWLAALACAVLALGVACRHSGPGSGAAPAAPLEDKAAKTVELDLDGVNLHDAVRAIAQQAGVNFSVDPDLDDPVSIHVRAIPWRQALEQLARQYKFRIVKAGPVLRLTRSPDAPREYTGAPIEVAFADTPISEVAKTFSALAGVTIAVDEDVHTLVTQRARHLPWDFVLDHIVRKYGLRLVRSGETLRITRP